MTYILNGLSGCKLELIENNIIRKYSSSPSYNERLNLQIQKQKLFYNYVFKNINTPRILNIDFRKLYSFDMEYVLGSPSFEYFSSCNLDDIDFVLSSLFSYFDSLISKTRYYKSNVSKKIILQKIDSLKDKTNHLNDLLFLENFVVNNNLNIPQTFCHGDLTFSNIIFHKNRIWFIDFLDSFIDSFLIDLIKLKQDLFYFWGLKNQKIFDKRIYLAYSFIWKNIEKKYHNYIHTIEFDVLDFLNSLRIDPYLTEERQRTIINTMIKDSGLYENINCSYGGTV
jgi:hypothetical protein